MAAVNNYSILQGRLYTLNTTPNIYMFSKKEVSLLPDIHFLNALLSKPHLQKYDFLKRGWWEMQLI